MQQFVIVLKGNQLYWMPKHLVMHARRRLLLIYVLEDAFGFTTEDVCA